MQAEFDDERPKLVNGQPAARQYKVIMLESNKPIGDFSQVANVVTKP